MSDQKNKLQNAEEPQNAHQVSLSNLVRFRHCKKCGYEGHDAKDCEYPHPQGHASDMRRNRDWSHLANKVVGGET